jgi:hypothetical protein
MLLDYQEIKYDKEHTAVQCIKYCQNCCEVLIHPLLSETVPMTSEYYKVIPLYCNLWTLQFLFKGQNMLNMSFAKIKESKLRK